jgi:hypothetical protein
MTIIGLGQRRPREGAAEAPTAPAARRGRPWLKVGLWAGGVGAALAATYLVAGYFLVPRVLRNAADRWAQDTLHKPLRIGEIRFDPIRFTLDVQDLAIPADPRPMLAAERIHVRFSFLSLLHGPYAFDEVRLERPLVRAVVRADRSLNLGDLAPKTKQPQKSGGRAVRIGTFAIVRGEAIYADDSLPGRPETILTPVAFTLKDFQTDAAAGGAFAFRGRSELGEGLVWTGNLSTAPLHSSGRLQVTALRARTIGAFLGSASPAAMQGGLLNVALAYDLRSAQEGLKLALTGADLDLSGLQAKAISGLPADVAAAADDIHVRLDRVGLALGGKHGVEVQAAAPSATVAGLSVTAPGQPVRIRSVALTDISLDTAARRITAAALAVDGAQASVRREADGRLSLAALMPKGAAAPAAPASAAQGQPWSVHLASFALRKAALQIDDAAVSPATHMVLSPIDLAVTDIDSDQTRPVGVKLGARMGGTILSVSGSAIPGTASGDFKVALSGLQLRPLLPYGPPLKDVDLTSGEASASGDLHVKGADMSALTFSGQAALDKVSVSQPSTKGLLVSWDAFRMEGLRYGAKGVTVEHAVLAKPVGRVVVMPDGTLNLAAVTGSAASPTQPAPTTPAKAAPQGAPQNATQPPSAPALPVTLKALDISGGTMQFADLSIDPNFQAPIQALQGKLTNVSTKPDSIVDIDLTGQVIDQYSPATIKGSMDLSGFDRQTDVRLTFSNIELPLFDPYSGKYAGYAIAKGKLTTEMTYKIDHRMLKADHHVVIDQLQWGEATESKDKAPIPVRLATALLKDKNGVIDLNVPVTGSMDDPKFKVWPIIWQIVRNTLEKAAAAPFRLIGGLFAGADKAETIDFDPGSAVLQPDTSQALGSLGKALAQRHELSLDIPAGPGLAEDAAAMAERRLDQSLLALKPKPATVAELGPDERLARLKALYKTQFHETPAPPPPAADQAKVTPQERKAMDTQWLHDRLRPAFTPTSAELQALGAERARVVRDALLAESGVDSKQVFVTPQNAPTAEDGHARLTLKLQ